LFPDSEIDASTIQAYRDTDYRVEGGHPFTLRIGARCAPLTALHATAGVQSSAFITAWNPFSQSLDDTANAQRQSALAAQLRHRGLAYLEGIGQHPDGQWPGERSFLVLGIEREAAKVLGQEHGQNAIVFCGESAIPELVLLR
jgi:hypothetical protein